MRFESLGGVRLFVILAGIAVVSGCAVTPSPRTGDAATSEEKPLAADTASRDDGLGVPLPGVTIGSTTPFDAQQPPPESPPPLPSLGAQAVTHALGLIGSPYRYGGTSPSGFDCSGLVRYSYQLAGLSLPRATGQQRETTRRLPPTEALQAGDLVFFSRGKTALHVGIFAGEGRFVHAATRGGGVRLDSLATPHWRQRFLEARRVAPSDDQPFPR